MSKAKLDTPALKAELKDAKTITLTWAPIHNVDFFDSYEVDDVTGLTKNYDDASNPPTATFIKTDGSDFVDKTKYNFFVTAKSESTSPDKDNSDKGTIEFEVNMSTLTQAPIPLVSSTSSSALSTTTGGKFNDVKMTLNVVANMDTDGSFKEITTIEESMVAGKSLKKDPSKDDMKAILNTLSGGARKSRKSRKTKRTKKGGKKRRSTKRSR